MLCYALRSLAGLLLILFLAGCGKPVSQEFDAYVGEWTAPGMYLRIAPDGMVKYKRVRNGRNVSLNGPIKSFDGNDFRIGFLIFSTTFKVSVPPHEEDGVWHMTVDGVDLVRSRHAFPSAPGERPPRSLQVLNRQRCLHRS